MRRPPEIEQEQHYRVSVSNADRQQGKGKIGMGG